jgi:hypothetical protein
MPDASSSCASACIRCIASSRASYSAWVKFGSSTLRPVWAIVRTGPRRPTWYTQLPITIPTGR